MKDKEIKELGAIYERLWASSDFTKALNFNREQIGKINNEILSMRVRKEEHMFDLATKQGELNGVAMLEAHMGSIIKLKRSLEVKEAAKEKEKNVKQRNLGQTK